MSGTATPNLPLSYRVDDLIANRNGNTVRIELARLVALMNTLQGPSYATRAELDADLAWPAGSVGTVFAGNYPGVYQKSGAFGAGSWAKIGDVPISAITAAQLAEKAGVADLAALITEVRSGRVYSAKLWDIASVSPQPGTDGLLTSIDNSIQYWAAISAPPGGVVTSTEQKDATGQWWKLMFDGRDLAAEVTARINATRDSGLLELTNVALNGSAITADLSPGSGVTTLAGSSTVHLISPLLNDGPITLNVAGAGVWPVQRRNGTELVAGDIKAGASYQLRRRGSAWRVNGLLDSDVQALVNVEATARAAGDSKLSLALRDGGTIPLTNIAGTGDAITADLQATMIDADITTLSAIAEVEYIPVAANAAANPTITIAGVTYGIRDADGGTWPAGGFSTARIYKLRRRASVMRVVSGAVTLSDMVSGRVWHTTERNLALLTPPVADQISVASDAGHMTWWRLAGVPSPVDPKLHAQTADGRWWRLSDSTLDIKASINALESGRVWATGVGSPSGQTPPPGTYRIQTPAGAGVQEWVHATAPTPATETDTLKLDATGQWWQRRFDSRDISTLASELYGIGLTSGVMRLPTVGGTADAITAEPAAQSANVVISNNSLLMLNPLLTTTASDPTLTTRGVTRTIRDADGGALRAGDLLAARTYILRVRSATEVRVVSGGVNQRDMMRLVAALPRQGTAATPVVQGVPEVGRTLAADYGTPESSAEIDWQVHDTGVGTQGWAVFASGEKVTLAAAQLGKFIRFRYRIGTTGVWSVSAVVGPVTELTDQTLIEVALLRQTVAQLESAIAALQSQTPGAPAMIAAPLDLYRQSAASPGIGWLGNVTAPLPSTGATMLTTYTPPENVIHPCMVELPQPLLGFKYISAITAYPNGPALEDPFVYGSNDRMNWTFLGSTPQPLDVKPPTTGAYNSDTFITHDPATGELIVGYRAYAPRDNTSSAAENSDVIIYIRRTKDGNTWTPREEIFRIQASVNIILSPTVIYDPVGGLWHMWTIYRPNMHHWTAPSISGPWTQDTATVSISAFNVPHHHEVKWVGNRLACLMYSRGDGNLYLGVFDDGSWTSITWSKIGILSPRPVSLYKASFLPVWSPDNQSVAFDVWWTTGAAGPAGGTDNNLGRKLQYARTNNVAVSTTPTLEAPPVGTITSPVIVGNPVSGSTLSVDTGGTSLDGYNFNWQWNTDGGTASTAVGTSSGVPYAPLTLDDAWIGRYIRCRYRMGTSGTWTISGFVGPVTAVAPSPEP